jgi:glutaredoxin
MLRHATIGILAAAFVFFVPLAAAQKLYKWVGPDGSVSYHDKPPPPGSPYKVEEKTLSGGRPATEAADRRAAPRPPVVLYTVPKCSSCDSARAHLQRRQVPFTEKNVESDRQAQEELRSKSGALSVPTILVGDKVMRGYLESLLDGELDAAGYAKAPATAAPEGGEAAAGGSEEAAGGGAAPAAASGR